MKTSDYIAQFIARQNVGHAFVISGGCIVHAIDSISRRPDLRPIPVQHEQAAAMAADGYARLTDNLGVALATSGPGATNLLTGVCCSYYDSVPVLLITGQVPTSQLRRDSTSRQIGFQETDVVSIYESVTKYAVLVDHPEDIRYELEKAVHIARSGRPGPVLLDVCDDVQRADIEPDRLRSFDPPTETRNLHELENNVDRALDLIQQAERPIVILGGGIRLAGAVPAAQKFIEALGFPVAPTWGGMDFIPYANPLVVGGFGVTSERPGNFAVQNADLVTAIGTRLDTHEAGPNLRQFAREAKKIIVDLDPGELEKFPARGMNVDLPICADAGDFFTAINPALEDIVTRDISPWLQQVDHWKRTYPICLPHYREMKDFVNPYVFMEALSSSSDEEDTILTDTGGNLIWTMQAFRMRGKQRIVSAFNHSPMGYSLPASMGAAFATGRPVTCITGDGGLQMNIQELATIQRNNLPIKIFVINNHGYGIIKQTLHTWLGGNYSSVDHDSGLPDPDYAAVAEAYGIPAMTIRNHDELESKVTKMLASDGPAFCCVELHPEQRMEPKLVYGKPIEDSAPLLPRDEFLDNMIVAPVDAPEKVS